MVGGQRPASLCSATVGRLAATASVGSENQRQCIHCPSQLFVPTTRACSSADGSPTHNEVHPLYPGVTVLVAHRNAIVSHFAVGKTLLYADANGTLLPEDQQIDSREDMIYDMASISKLFTTILALDQLGQVSRVPGWQI